MRDAEAILAEAVAAAGDRIRAALANRDQSAALKKDAEKDLETSESLFAGGVVTTTHVRKTRLQLQAATETLAAAEALRAVADTLDKA